jgi:hypothetical protein
VLATISTCGGVARAVELGPAPYAAPSEGVVADAAMRLPRAADALMPL